MADIELVIRIPEEIYKASQIIEVKYEDTVQIPLEVIANSTPLPKGHGRLIDADALNRKDVNCANVPMNFIDSAHTIIKADMAEGEAMNDSRRD